MEESRMKTGKKNKKRTTTTKRMKTGRQNDRKWGDQLGTSGSKGTGRQ